jgi:hypothetical protein
MRLFIAIKLKNNISVNTIWLPRKYFRKSECDHVKTNSSEYHCLNDVSKLTRIEVHRRKRSTNHTNYPLLNLSHETNMTRWTHEAHKMQWTKQDSVL